MSATLALFLLLRTLMLAKLERPSTPLEIRIGRSIALCVHPSAAWRTQSNKRRALVIIAYVVASYAITLGALAAGLGA